MVSWEVAKGSTGLDNTNLLLCKLVVHVHKARAGVTV